MAPEERAVNRVAFAIPGHDPAWLGGINYFRNLIGAVLANPERRIEPVLVRGPGAASEPALVEGLGPIETIRTRIFTSRTLPWLARVVARRIVRRDVGLERFLRGHRIDLLSHTEFLEMGSSFPTLGWMPDFQYVHLPQLYPEAERARIEATVLEKCARCTRMIVSSETAKKDLAAVAPTALERTRVLRFVADPGAVDGATGRDALVAKYDLPPRWFHLPNQFWVHKNHGVVVDALAILKSRGVDVRVAATGNTRDHRDPEYFARLMATVESKGVGDRFRVLGIVPWPDVIGLFRASIAVINPSLFEGWSTTVEEAKSLGKRTVLSDIAVHREQDPPSGRFFATGDAEGLAAILEDLAKRYDPAADLAREEAAKAALPQRRRDFALTYEEIALEAISAARIAKRP
jgi:glycosyltransferase involved in cell wall biosynthesis